MILDAPTIEDMEQARLWRNDYLAAMRTPYYLTKEMQEQFYRDIVCNRASNARFWAVRVSDKFIGLAGLTSIEWENRIAEISLMIPPEFREEYFGKAVDLILHEGFSNMNLANIYVECYECNPLIGFWKYLATVRNVASAVLPNRKYWQGRYWNSLYVNFDKTILEAGE